MAFAKHMQVVTKQHYLAAMHCLSTKTYQPSKIFEPTN